MITEFVFLIFFSFSLFGYTFLCKKIFHILIYDKSKFKINNLDILFGYFLVITLLLITHFFIPIKNISLIIIIFGIFFFIQSLFKKKIYQINFVYYSLILFLLIYINSSNSPLYDTQLYHHQIINWNYNFKIANNLALVDGRLGMISPWQLLLSIGNFKFLDVKLSYLINHLPFALIFNEMMSISKKTNKFNAMFISLCVFFILFFSIIHPFGNGTIMMNIGSLGTDVPAMIFFILAIYIFLNILDDHKILFQHELLIVCSILTVFCRISYLPVLLLPIYLLFQKKNFFENIKTNLFFISVIILWLFRSLINNGCLIFPAKISCLNFPNTISLSEVEKFSYIIKSFARTAPDHAKFMDLNYSVISFNWIKPWFMDYFLQQSLTFIFMILIFVTFIPCLFILFKYELKIKRHLLPVFILFFLLFLLWLQAPDIRFGLGFLISLPCLLITIVMHNFTKYFEIRILKYIFISLFIILSFKNNENLSSIISYDKFYNQYKYSNFKIISTQNEFQIVKNNNPDKFCYDVNSICILKNKINFSVKKNSFGYVIFKRKQD